MNDDNVMGAGRHTYELDRDWPKLPNSLKLGYTHGVAVDSQNRIIIFNQSNDAILLLDSDGKLIKSWNHGFERGAHGLTLNKEEGGEFLYLCDYELPRVCKTTLDGEIVWSIDEPPPLKDVYPEKKKYRPTNIAIADNGDFYVADGYGQNWIHQYDAKRNYIRSFGGPGSDLGKLNCPHSLTIDRRGKDPVVLVADRANVRLQTFKMDGQPIATFGRENLRHPCHFDVNEDGDLLVPDLHGRVTIFDRDNKLITHLGDNPGVWQTKGYPNLPHEQRTAGKFISPHSACWDATGNMYIVEWVNDGRITRLRRA